MSYFSILLVFVVVPTLAILALLKFQITKIERLILMILSFIALTYTTPWDNYLVANRIWWYDPDLVKGLTIWWVPIEEYTFFILQSIFTGIWLIFLSRKFPHSPIKTKDSRFRLRTISVIAVGLAWFSSVIILFSKWLPGTYLALELSWFLPPIMVQLGFGADILWKRRSTVAAAILSATIYLAIVDAIAIKSGTWTINPALTTNFLIGNLLPIEEFIFFLLTNILIVFTMTLGTAPESLNRLHVEYAERLRILIRKQFTLWRLN